MGVLNPQCTREGRLRGLKLLFHAERGSVVLQGGCVLHLSTVPGGAQGADVTPESLCSQS